VTRPTVTIALRDKRILLQRWIVLGWAGGMHAAPRQVVVTGGWKGRRR
jgi:hypothetical protein